MPENQVIPLRRWIHGRLRIHFRNGHIAELEMSLEAAESLRKQIDDKQGAESIYGLHAHDGWVSAKGEEVVMTEWEPAFDYGWPNATADERAAMKALGMRRGVLHALATLWADRGRHDVGYSATAVATLHSLTTSGSLTRAQWDQLAEMVEGEDGVRLLNELAFDVPATRARPSARRERPDGSSSEEASAQPPNGSVADQAVKQGQPQVSRDDLESGISEAGPESAPPSPEQQTSSGDPMNHEPGERDDSST